MYAIECRALRKTYFEKPPVEAVRGLDLAVRIGECFGLLGPNGAGKTTTIEILEGILPATSGEVRILGLDWNTDHHVIRQQIGISLQETRLLEKLTVRETVTLFRSMYRQGFAVEEAIELVSLTEKSSARVGKLSGGQKQRLNIACAIVGDPQLLFLDEPTTGLDPAARRELWAIIRRFRDHGKTVLLTTHYMDEAERLCDRVAVVDHGRVIAEGTPQELILGIGGEHIVHFEIENDGDLRLLESQLAGLPDAIQLRQETDGFVLTATELHRLLPALIDRLNDMRRPLVSLSTRHATLDDVFLKLAGRHISADDSSTTAP